MRTIPIRSSTWVLFAVVAVLSLSHSTNAQTVTVTAPVNGAAFKPGDTVHVRWSATGTQFVTVNATVDGGMTYNMISSSPIRSTDPQWGDFVWTIPQDVSGSSCRVRVADYSNMTLSGLSGIFSIGSGTVVDPVIGLPSRQMTIAKDTVFTMTVVNTGGGELPDLSVSGVSSPWLTVVIDNSPVNTATLTTTLSGAGLADGTYRDTVTLSGSGVASVSYTVDFHKGTPGTEIVVTDPAGGESFAAGDSIRVRWTAQTGVSSVMVRISADNGLMWTHLGDRGFSRNDALWGDARFQIPENLRGLPSGSCVVGVCDYSQPSLQGVSKAFFVNGVSSGGVPRRVEIYPSRAMCAPRDTIRLQASVFDVYGDVVVEPVTWRVAQGAGVITTNGVFTAGDSVGDFPVIASISTGGLSATGLISVRKGVSGAAPVTVVSPNGGEVLQVGQPLVVEWAADAKRLPGAVVWLSLDNGMTWNTMNDRVITYADSAWGRFVWMVPQNINGSSVVSTTCRVKVTDYSSMSVFDASDSSFSIIAPVATLVDRSGGNVSLGSTVQVEIPANARKAADVADTLRIVQTRTTIDPPSGFQIVNSGDVFVFLPHGTTFDAPVEICIPYEGADANVKILHRTDDTATVWDTLSPTRVDAAGSQVCFSTTHFSVYAVARTYTVEQAVRADRGKVSRVLRRASPLLVRRVPSGLCVETSGSGLHEVTILRLDGRVLVSFRVSGDRSTLVPAEVLGTGTCIVRVKSGRDVRTAIAVPVR